MMELRQQLSELQRAFVLPARLKESRPRDVQLTGGGRALFVLAIVLFASAVGAPVVLTQESIRQAANRAALAERGVTTSGVVTRIWSDDDNRRKVAYRFEAEGRSFASDINVSSARRRTLDVGSPIDVRFLPGNPDVNDLGASRSGLPLAIGPTVGVGLATGGAILLFSIRRQRRLLEDGRAAPAVVTGHKSSHSSHSKHYSMTYDFALLSGAVVKGKAGTSKNAPPVGSVITVIYDPERPEKSRVYPFSLVRPA
jgi:hypothetical protein